MSDSYCKVCRDSGEWESIDSCGCCTTKHFCICAAGIKKRNAPTIETLTAENSQLRADKKKLLDELNSCCLVEDDDVGMGGMICRYCRAPNFGDLKHETHCLLANLSEGKQ